MQVGVGYSDCPDSQEAGVQAAKMALEKAGRTRPCDMVLLFCTAHHNQQQLRDAVSLIVGSSRPIYGGGAAGVITNDYFGYAGDQVGVVCIWMDDSSYTVLMEKGLADGEEEAGIRLGKRLLEKGITPDSPMMLFYDAINRKKEGMPLLLATWLLEGLEKGMGFMPEIMGAGLQGDHSCSPTMQFTGEGMEEHSAISLTFSEDICIDNIIMHGCRPASPYYTVTKADGPVILEINEKPAIQFIDEVLESSIAPENYPFFLLFGLNHGEPWGEYDESNYASRLCLDIDKERGGIVMFEPDMVEGMEFQIMFRSLDLEYMKPKIEKIFSRLDGREPIFAMYIDCAGRCAGYGGMDIEDAIVIQKAVGKAVPLLGIYTGAEIAPMGGRSRGLDLTGVFCLFSKRAKGEGHVKREKEQPVWNQDMLHKRKQEEASVEVLKGLCERNAAKVLALDTASIAIRHELEQKRRGFSLLAELSVSLRDGSMESKDMLSLTQRINSALNMQKTAVLIPDSEGIFFPYVLQGYSEEEKEQLTGQPVEVEEELLDPEQPVLVTAADSGQRLFRLREKLQLPYFVSAPVIVKNEVVAILITGRMVEAAPFLSRLGRSDVETVQAVSALLAYVLVYRQLDDAKKLARSDALTGLLNRGALELWTTQRLTKELPEGKKFAFMVLDFDYFKEINDCYGHLEGDLVLNSLARFLEKYLRAEDYIARIGGDEFAVFCALKGRENKEIIEVRMIELVREWSEYLMYTKSGIAFYSNISVGIAFAPDDGSTYEELYKNADVALYKAKQLGRNRCCIYNAKTMTDM